MKSRAVFLLNLGGPESLAEVEPFLKELFDDILPARIPRLFRTGLAGWLARRRAPVSKGYYTILGGGSPLRSITQIQASQLQAVLPPDTEVSVVMRYARPRAQEVIERVRGKGISEIVLFPLYPQYSKATTESSVREITQLVGPEIVVRLIRSWWSEPTYLDFFARWIGRYLSSQMLRKEEIFFLFTAHGLPRKLIQEGDPYFTETEGTVKEIVKRVAIAPNQYRLGFQSKLGRSRWLEPSTADCLRDLATEGRWRHVMLVPVSFVSDHVETLYELDIFLQDIARKMGAYTLYRLPMFNDSQEFTSVLRDVYWNAEKSTLSHGNTLKTY